MFLFLYHYTLPFYVYAYTFDMCTNKVYLLTYLLTIFRPFASILVLLGNFGLFVCTVSVFSRVGLFFLSVLSGLFCVVCAIFWLYKQGLKC